jgi:hypothetical protein
MGPLYFLVISIITSTGELQMEAMPVPNCETNKQAFVQLMEEAKGSGEIKDWNALCLTVGDKGHAI